MILKLLIRRYEVTTTESLLNVVGPRKKSLVYFACLYRSLEPGDWDDPLHPSKQLQSEPNHVDSSAARAGGATSDPGGNTTAKNGVAPRQGGP
jgi:hypothetical protein